MKKYLIGLTLFIFHFGLSAQGNLDASKIPKDLLSGANAVVRYDNLEFTIQSNESVVTTRTWAITIFNEKGERDHATFKTYYDKLSKIKDIECSIYDRYGVEQKKLRRGDIEDIGLGFSSQEVVDNRMKIATFDDKKYEYPYTVAFHYIKESNNPMFYPTWYPIRNENTSVEMATFFVNNRSQTPFRYKETCVGGVKESKVFISKEDKRWTVNNLKAFENEPMSGDDGQIGILLAPAEFELDGVTGNLSSWENASSFYYKFNEGRQTLPAETVQKVKQLTTGVTDQLEKVKLVYEYMQSHTRYMSIQLGVGGWQTIPADKVANDGYGDCKALTNYTVALLREVGIKEACPALIAAGKSNRFSYPDFSRMNFNHVIACVPMKEDTIWLECTSQTNPFGYLGTFTGNRKALLIMPSGGRLVNTKSYTPEDNHQKRRTQISLSEDGSAEISMNNSYTGIQQEMRTAILENYSAEEQKQWLLKQVDLPNFELKSFTFTPINSPIPELEESLELSSRKLASKSGKRMFLRLNPLSSFFGTPSKLEERQTEIYLNENVYNVLDEDEIVFQLPEGIEIEYLPKEAHFKSAFGTYDAVYKREGDTLKVNRKVKMQGGLYPASDYQELYDFLKKVNKADKAKAVMVVGET